MVVDRLLPFATVSALSGVHEESFKSFLNSTRYVWPAVVCHTNTNNWPFRVVCVICGGAMTKMENVSVSPSGGVPLSVTRTVAVLVLGVCAGVGVQVNTPVAELIAAPAGAPGSRVNVSVCGGWLV